MSAKVGLKYRLIVINWNGFEDTGRCLESIKAAASGRGDVGLLVLDNGSTDDQAGALKRESPSIDLLRSKTNLGFAGGNNLAIKWALRRGGSWLILLNNDTIVAKNFFQVLDEELSEPALYGGKGYYLGSEIANRILSKTERPLFEGGEIDWLRGTGRHKIELKVKNRQGRIEVDFLTGACLIVHRKIFRSVGLFDEAFFAYNEDADFCLRARKKGVSIYYLPRLIYWHKEAASTGKKSPTFWYLNTRNKWLLMKKHASPGRWPAFLLYFFFVKPLAFRLLALLKFNRENLEAFRATLNGTADAILGRFGQPE